MSQLPHPPRWMIAEAILSLMIARFLLFIPLRYILGRLNEGTWDGVVRPPDDPEAYLIGRALALSARRLPFHCTCLVRALAGRAMLRRRRIAHVVHFGVAQQDGNFSAHAWLTAGGGTVTGGREAIGFVPIARLPSDDANRD
jgi:hypothetical protein